MDSQTKRTLLATILCMGVMVGWFQYRKWANPPKKTTPVAQSPATPSSSGDATPATQASSEQSEIVKADAAEPPVVGSAQGSLKVIGADKTQTVALGDDRYIGRLGGTDNPYLLKAVISTRGASVETVTLAEHRNAVPQDRKNPKHDPYVLLQPLVDPTSEKSYLSFVTESVRLLNSQRDIDLASANWALAVKEDAKGQTAELTANVEQDGRPFLRIKKSYRLNQGDHHLVISYEIENLSRKPERIRLTERGPIGAQRQEGRFDNLLVLAASIDEQKEISVAEKVARDAAFKAVDASHTILTSPDSHILWTSLGNKYFGCIVMPQPSGDEPYASYLEKVAARSLVNRKDDLADLTFEQVFVPKASLAAGETLSFHEEAFCGPKSSTLYESLPPEVKARKYEIASYADRSSCAPDAISNVMLWLLNHIYMGVHNYGIAIIILVIIVRLVLHPVSKRGQIAMMRTQKNMAKIKPKMDEIQQKYKNDRARLQEETTKLYREEGVNPGGMIFGCLPMMLQMPIWVALWTTLNTNVDMRHMPFFGYIRDLSAPDALITFASAFHIPLIGAMTGPIHSFNLLPLVMSAVMFAQQKITQKMAKPDTPPPPKLDKDGNPLPDTMAQQQKIMSFMMIFFGVMFYNFPSGLCLYILSSSLLGMAEQMYIRKHLREKENRGDFDSKPPESKKPGWLVRKLEKAQKMAEQQRLAAGKAATGKDKQKPGRKKPRF